MFPAPDDDSTLALHVELLGRENFDRFTKEQGIEISKELATKLPPPGRRKPWGSILPMGSIKNTDLLIDLLEKLFEFNFVNRF